MPKRKKRAATKKKKDDSPDVVSESDSLDRPPSAKKVAAASSTSLLEDDVESISSFTTVSLINSSRSDAGDTGGQSSHFWCNYCEFSADTKKELVTHMRQHMIKCPHCPFNSLSRNEVVRHCRFEHDKDFELSSQEVDSSGTECGMDKDPCSACVFCSFMTYSTEHLEKHTAQRHPGMLAKSVAKMITKQASAEVRRDDAIFYLATSGDSGVKSSSSEVCDVKVKLSDSIVIDEPEEKSDVKPDLKPPKPDIKPAIQEIQSLAEVKPLNPVKEQLAQEIISDLMSTPAVKDSAGDLPVKGSATSDSSSSLRVKVETMYCLTCPYSNVYIEKLKCHTSVQHPVGAAAATYNATGQGMDAQDITFFCIREDCSHSTSDCSSYQKHLMSCCACMETLKVLEKERLKSTITYVLDHQKTYNLKAEHGFFDFASSYLGFPVTRNPAASTPLSQPGDRPSRNSSRDSNSISGGASHSSTPPGGIDNKMAAMASLPVNSMQVTNRQSVNSNFVSSNENFQGSMQSFQTANNPSNNQRQQGGNKGGFKGTDNIANQPVSFSMNSQSKLQSFTNVQTALPPADSQYHAGYLQQGQSDPNSFRNFPDMGQVTPTSWPVSDQSSSSLAQGLLSGQPVPNMPESFQNQPTDSPFATTQTNVASGAFQGQTGLETNSITPSPAAHNFPYVPSAAVDNNYSQQQPIQTMVNNPDFAVSMGQPVFNTTSNQFSADSMPNSSTSQSFNTEQRSQQPASDTLSTGMDINMLDSQPQPRMMDLLSDSYSILLSDGLDNSGQVQDTISSSHNERELTPLMPSSSYQLEIQAGSHNQSMIPHSSSGMSQDVAHYQSSQHDMTGSQQSSTNFYPASTGLPASQNMASPQTRGGQYTRSHSGELSFQTNTQYTVGSGIDNNSLSSGQATGVQSLPSRNPQFPNFLVTSAVATSAPVSTQQMVTASSFLNPHAHSAQTGTFTPPRNSVAVTTVGGGSPLSPSIYLSGKAPRHRRSNWTDADMRPRGASSLPPMRPRAPLPQGQLPGAPAFPFPNVRQRLFTPPVRGRGSGSPRMSAPRGRGQQPRMSRQNVGGDDDEVIVTAVTRRMPAPPEQQMQPRQQSPRGTGRRGMPGLSPRGRGQVPSPQNRIRGQVPHPMPLSPHQPPRQIDISKHFEDLACVVNSTEDERIRGDDDIEIVGVTPGKDKPSQPKAVDACKFSFCCVHCGKDQGSKKVMKQHMKARHNDSLLGAFTNIETGQLLFFCPQLTCEFMTYDEKRLGEHLSKCYDLDKSKPFDFETALKNLKSLKIRQMDVRTMGYSRDDPIDLDGQGMKDRFSSSLNDAFDDIVVNTTGRNIVRPPNLPQPTLRQPQPSQPTASPMMRAQGFSPQQGGMRGPPRLPSPSGSPASRPRMQGYPDRMYRPQRGMRHPRPQNPNMRPNIRYPPNSSSGVPPMQGPRMPARGPIQRGIPPPQHPAPPPQSGLPIRPVQSGNQQEPIVIDLDADSPEPPATGQQNTPQSHESPQASMTQSLRLMSLPSVPNTAMSFHPSHHYSLNSPATQVAASQDQHSYPLAANLDNTVPSTAEYNPMMSLQALSTQAPQTQIMTLPVQVNPYPSESVTESEQTSFEQGNRSLSTVETNPEISNASQHAVNTVGKAMTNISNKTAKEGQRSSLLSATSGAFDTSTVTSCQTTASERQTTAASSVTTEEEQFDEEEKINSIVLEKVFAKVPNMPKNLSRRLVLKFKQFANYKGVKITSDSKVIDEFVSKIYYKGSSGSTDKDGNKTQPSQAQAQAQDSSKSLEAGANPPQAKSLPASSEVSVTEGGRKHSGDGEGTQYSTTQEVPHTSSGTVHEGNDETVNQAIGEGIHPGGCESVHRADGETDHQFNNASKNQVSSERLNDAIGESPYVLPSEQGTDNTEEQTMAVQDSQTSGGALTDEIMTTQVILAQRNLQFSGAFAKIALKATSATSQSPDQSSHSSTEEQQERSAYSHQEEQQETRSQSQVVEQGDNPSQDPIDEQDTHSSHNHTPELQDAHLQSPVAEQEDLNSQDHLDEHSRDSHLKKRSPNSQNFLDQQQEDNSQSHMEEQYCHNSPSHAEEQDLVSSEQQELNSENHTDEQQEFNTENHTNGQRDGPESDIQVQQGIHSQRIVDEQQSQTLESLIDGQEHSSENNIEEQEHISQSLSDEQLEHESQGLIEEHQNLRSQNRSEEQPCHPSYNKTMEPSVSPSEPLSPATDDGYDDMGFPLRRHSTSIIKHSKAVTIVRRSQTFPSSLAETCIVTETDEEVIESMPVTVTSFPQTSLVAAPSRSSQGGSVEVCVPTVEISTMQSAPFIGKNAFLLEEDPVVTLPAIAESESKPIVITSNVDHLVAGNPALEVDIAGIPFKQEPSDASDKAENPKCSPSLDKDGKECEEAEKVKKVARTIIDKTTGQLLPKKTKRGQARRMVSKGSEDEAEEIDQSLYDLPGTSTATHFIRRSARSHKPIHRDYQTDMNEIDELMSDDDDEYNIDDDSDDYGTDSEKEWEDGSEQPPRKKAKKVSAPPDPTAFNVKEKGKFKCWQCRKLLFNCLSAKTHIIKKHIEGLCAIDLEVSEKSGSLSLLLFCPRNCRYATISLEGYKNHTEACDRPLLKDEGEKYLEINENFIDNSYEQLQAKTVNEILEELAKKKSKPLSASAKKSKKSKVASDTGPLTAASVIIAHSEATLPIDLDVSVTSDSTITSSHQTSAITVTATSAASINSHESPPALPVPVSSQAGQASITETPQFQQPQLSQYRIINPEGFIPRTQPAVTCSRPTAPVSQPTVVSSHAHQEPLPPQRMQTPQQPVQTPQQPVHHSQPPYGSQPARNPQPSHLVQARPSSQPFHNSGPLPRPQAPHGSRPRHSSQPPHGPLTTPGSQPPHNPQISHGRQRPPSLSHQQPRPSYHSQPPHGTQTPYSSQPPQRPPQQAPYRNNGPVHFLSPSGSQPGHLPQNTPGQYFHQTPGTNAHNTFTTQVPMQPPGDNQFDDDVYMIEENGTICLD